MNKKIPIDDTDFQKLIRSAAVYLRRGDSSSARSHLDQALEIEPDSAEGLELMGDVLSSAGDLEEAALYYKKALTINPALDEVELKYARIVLKLAESELHDSSTSNKQNSPLGYNGRHAKAVTMLASAILPGLGQWMNGEYAKAYILAGVYGFCLVFLLLSGGLRQLLDLWLSLFAASNMRSSSATNMGLLTSFLWGGWAVSWLYAIIDAPIRAGRFGKNTNDSYTEPQF